MDMNSMTEDSNISRSMAFIKHKIVFLGNTSVGKTSIINRFIFDNFQESDHPTVGIDFISKTLHVDDKKIKLQLWDTAGQERFRTLIPYSAVAFLVYDVTKKQTFDDLQNWYDDVRTQRGEDVIIIIVGNKTDLIEQRQVKLEQGSAKAKEWGVNFLEVSAKSGDNVHKLFNMVATLLPNTDNSQILNVNQQDKAEDQNQNKNQPMQLNQQNQNIQNNQNQQQQSGCC